MTGPRRLERRFVGTRDDMVVYDCEDAEQLGALEERLAMEELIERGMVSTFGPDTLSEARNRGFHPR